MKKLLFAGLILASLTSQAQKGDILVGGNIGLSTENNKNSEVKITDFTFTPTVGYFFSNTWTAGLVANAGSSKITTESVTSANTTNFAIGPFVRYTQNISKIFGIYYQAQGLFGSEKDKLSGDKTNTTAINLFPAIFLNVKNGFGINASFGGINFGSSKPSGGQSDNTFSISLGQVVSLGVSKTFGTGKK